MNTTLVLDAPDQLSALGAQRFAYVRVMELEEAPFAAATVSPEELLRQEKDTEFALRSVVAAGGEGALRPVLDGSEVHAVLAGLGYWSADPALDDLGD